MNIINFRLNLILVLCVFPTTVFSETTTIPIDYHHDVLTVNPSLQLRDVLEKAFLRNPSQSALQSKVFMVEAKATIANALLPTTPVVSIAHQNDRLGSGRGEREWQAELDLPVWMPNQRHYRSKVADATQANLAVSRESLKLQVAGLVRDAIWTIRLNDNVLALASHKVDTATKLQRDVEKRYQAGEMAKSDAMLAQQESLRAKRELILAEAELMHARHRYSLLTGLVEMPENFSEVQSKLEDYTQSSIWSEAQSKLGLAEQERTLANIESHENMQVLVNMRNAKGAFDAVSNNSVGVALRIPFGGEARAVPIKAVAEMGVGNAISELEAVRFTLESAMHEAEHNLNVSREELKIAQMQFDLSKESVKLAQKAFDLGEADLVNLLRAQTQAYENERTFTTRQIQVQWNIARYNQAVGVLP